MMKYKKWLFVIMVLFNSFLELSYADVVVSTEAFMNSVKEGEDEIIETQGKVNEKIIKKVVNIFSDIDANWSKGSHIKIEAWKRGFIVPSICDVKEFKIWGEQGICRDSGGSPWVGHVYPKDAKSIKGSYMWSAIIMHNTNPITYNGEIFIQGPILL